MELQHEYEAENGVPPRISDNNGGNSASRTYDSYDVHYDDLHYLSKYRGGHFCFFACSRRKKSSSSSTVLYRIHNILEEQVRSVDSDL